MATGEAMANLTNLVNLVNLPNHLSVHDAACSHTQLGTFRTSVHSKFQAELGMNPRTCATAILTPLPKVKNQNDWLDWLEWFLTRSSLYIRLYTAVYGFMRLYTELYKTIQSYTKLYRNHNDGPTDDW